ncbi:MAG: GNAT family N-acetyltransferase [Bacteroidota bacterium]
MNKESVRITSLSPLDLDQMHEAFLDSFRDYPIQFSLTKEQFVKKFVQKLKIDFELSAGAFDGDRLVGFVFSSSNVYEGKTTAYNGGTGVRRPYRNQGITFKLYERLIPKFKEKGIEQGILEVLTTNTRAIRAYERIGFQKSKYFHCFKLPSRILKKHSVNRDVTIEPVPKPNWALYNDFIDYSPSFLDSQEMINVNLSNETIIEAHLNGQCVGYTIYQPALGRIGSLTVDKRFRNKGIGSTLLDYVFRSSSNKSLTVINANRESTSTKDFFVNRGFENQLDQYEMKLML